jgi:hypothetical protein
MTKEQIIKDIMLQCLNIRAKFGHYPSKIEVCKQEWLILQDYRSFNCDPDWFISICGSRVVCYNG